MCIRTNPAIHINVHTNNYIICIYAVYHPNYSSLLYMYPNIILYNNYTIYIAVLRIMFNCVYIVYTSLHTCHPNYQLFECCSFCHSTNYITYAWVTFWLSCTYIRSYMLWDWSKVYTYSMPLWNKLRFFGGTNVSVSEHFPVNFQKALQKSV